MKKYIVETSSGELVCFRSPSKKPGLVLPTYTHVDPVTHPMPSLEHIWSGTEWIESQKLLNNKKLRLIKQNINTLIKEVSEIVQCHEESLELVTRGVPGCSADLTDTKYQEFLIYRYDLNHLLETTSITGIWTFTKNSPTVTGSGGAASTEIIIGTYIQLDSEGIQYKISSVTDNDTIVLTRAYQQENGSGNASIGIDLDNVPYPTKPTI